MLCTNFAYQYHNFAFKGMYHEKASWTAFRDFPTTCISTGGSIKHIRNWRYNDWDNINGVDNEDFLDTIHHNLNVAVYYTAAVLNYLVDKYTYTCIFLDNEQIVDVIKKYQLDFPVMMLLTVAGGWATFFSLATTQISEKVFKALLKKISLPA